MANAPVFVEGKLRQRKIMMFSKSWSPECKAIKEILKDYHKFLPEDVFENIDIDKRSDSTQVEDYLWTLSGLNNREVPLLFIKGFCVGGYATILRLHQKQELGNVLRTRTAPGKEEELDEDDIRSHSMVVRIEELDDTEVYFRVVELGPDYSNQPTAVDYDAFSDPSYLQHADSLAMDVHRRKQRGETVIEYETKNTQRVKLKENVNVDPECMFLGGSKKTMSSSVSLPEGFRSFLMLRQALSFDRESRTSKASK